MSPVLKYQYTQNSTHLKQLKLLIKIPWWHILKLIDNTRHLAAVIIKF